MGDGSTEGTQCFDDEIEKMIRAGVIDIQTGLSYSTNAGNLRLHLADLLEPQGEGPAIERAPSPKSNDAPVSTHAMDPEFEHA
jgi:Tfp pilus assembly ATPase PilU